MKKLAYVVAAVTAIAVAAPSIASARTVIIEHGRRHHHDWHPHHDWHSHHHDRIVIKHRH